MLAASAASAASAAGAADAPVQVSRRMPESHPMQVRFGGGFGRILEACRPILLPSCGPGAI